ncbi:MAG: regulatory protein RecX [Oscillospiraceae bacterium]|nr:regulatory protein RecX [Oscillospiraceae bacterium]
MIISDISPFKGSMMCIELAGGGLAENMKIYIHSDIVRKNGIAKGMEISEEEADRLIYQNDLRRARERALYLMESRDHSYSELFDKLEKNYSEDICFEVCSRLAEMGVINDRRYAEKLCRQLFEVKKLGRFRVKQEMRLRGLSSEIIEETLENFSEEDEPFERLEALVEQKYERYLTDRKGVQKVKNALARKGYSFGEIKAVLDLYDLDFEE